MLRVQLPGSEYDSVKAQLLLWATGVVLLSGVSSTSAQFVSNENAVGPPDTAELADVRAYLSALSEAFTNTVTVFDDESLGFTSAAIDAEWRALSPATDAAKSRGVLAYFRVGTRRALLLHRDPDVVNAEDCRQADRMACWTGTEWYETERRSNTRTHTFSPIPRPRSAVDYVAVFNSSNNWPSFLGTHDLAAFVQPSLLKERAEEGEELRLTFWASETAHTATIQVALSTQPTLRLEAVTLTFGRVSADDPTPFGRKVLRIDAWQRFEDSLIPRIATYFDGRIDDEDGHGATPVMTRRLTRRSIRRIEAGGDSEACLAPVPVADGDQVLDTCFGLRYKIGEPVLFADHLRIELDQPIQSRVTTRLADFVGEIEKVGDGRFRKKDG